MSSHPTVREVARNFSAYIDRVRSGERFVLMDNKEPVAELRPVETSGRLGELPDLLASLPRLLPEDLAAFESDLEAARSDLNPQIESL